MKHFFLFTAFVSCTCFTLHAQNDNSIITSASQKYNKSKGYQKRWGKHYRAEWATPVKFKKVNLDTLAGGLTPYQAGGGRQSKSLRLHDTQKHEYVLRSIDKSFGKALPEIAQGTFIETLINDQVTIGHPYSAVTIAPLAEAAGIYHTWPEIVYVPAQPRLGNYNDSFANTLYLFEQRPDENWETAANFGNAKNIVSTDKMLEKLLKDNDRSVDQQLFARSRLFDMFIGDWGRHEDQWRWAEIKDDDKTVFKPIPRDRDQAYSVFDGKLLKIAIKAAGAKHLQTFDHSIKNLKRYNFTARNLDHHFTNELTQNDWVSIANDLKARLTDDVIESAIHQLPSEVFSLSGPDIIAKLKSRRELLPQIASDYYKQLAMEADIHGSNDNELFEVAKSKDSVTVSVYKIKKSGETAKKSFYQRTFYGDETNEVRLFGIDGNDRFHITGNSKSKIRVRLIGGDSKDEYIDEQSNNLKRTTIIYDDRKNDFNAKHSRLRLSNDSSVHEFDYDAMRYSKNKIKPMLFYSNADRVYVGLGFSRQKHGWRKDPYAQLHKFNVKYSISQQAFSTTYSGSFTDILRSWDLDVLTNYDWERWTNFYGLGNNSVLETTTDRDFNRIRSKEFIASAGLQNTWGKSNVYFRPYYQSIDLLRDTNRFLEKTVTPDIYHNRRYAGAELGYNYVDLNDPSVPTKGVSFRAAANYTDNLKSSKLDIARYLSELNVFVPFTRTLGLFVRTGGATLTGNPEFFQYNSIGGTETLRGHQRNRFYGNHTFYNQNELRWIKDVRSYLYNGKLGVYALFDDGRVWLKNEKSNKWHMGYGGGLIISPFNKITLSVAYAFSDEDRNFHFDLIRAF